MDSRLIEYIKKERRLGFTDEKIRNVLISAGYDEQTVDNAFSEAIERNPSLEFFKREKNWILSAGGIVLLIGVLVFVIMAADTGDPDNKPKINNDTEETTPDNRHHADKTTDKQETQKKPAKEFVECKRDANLYRAACYAVLENDINHCMQNGKTNKHCERFYKRYRAIMQDSTSACQGTDNEFRKECMMLAEKDASACTSDECSQAVEIAKKLKNNDSSACEKLNDKYLTMACKAVLSSDKSSCREINISVCPPKYG